MDADGGNRRNLTRSPAHDGGPAWSPDGQQIAFVRDQQIQKMNADGSAQRRLTRSDNPEQSPAWSPDGKRIAFVRWSRRGNGRPALSS